MPAIADLRYLFFGGGSDAEFTFLKNASTAGVTAASTLRSAFDNDDLTTGELTRNRREGFTATPALVSGQMYLSFFTAKKTETCSQIGVWTSTTAAGATPTDVHLSVYSVAANGDGTSVAATANDTTLLAAASTGYVKSFVTPFSKVAGQRYACAIRVVSAAAMPTLLGVGAVANVETDAVLGLAPRLCAQVAAGTGALPASFTEAGLTNSRRHPLFLLLP